MNEILKCLDTYLSQFIKTSDSFLSATSNIRNFRPAIYRFLKTISLWLLQSNLVFQPPSPPPHDKYSETNVHRYTSHHTSTHHSSNGYAGRNVGNGHPPASPATPEHSKTVTIVEQTDLGERQPEREKLIEKTESKGASGPPVYYPPGVELFTKKEEAMMQKQVSWFRVPETANVKCSFAKLDKIRK